MRRFAQFIAAALLAACAVAAGLWTSFGPGPAVASGDLFFSHPGDASRGSLIFAAAGCESCHATTHGAERRDETNQLGGGLAFRTSFGVFYAPNISSDKRDGIGSWTDAQVANAFLSGIGRDGGQLYPVLPYTSYARMSRADARDLIAYLRTLPPVSGRPPADRIKFPFSFRPMIALWKALFFHPQPIEADPAHDAAWNRGRYLSEALAHCAQCHSPRGPLGAIVQSQRFAGGPDAADPGQWVPNITPDHDGLAGWTQDDMVQLLRDGLTPDDDKVESPMIEVVHNIARLPKSDAQAIAAYILSLPARKGPPEPKTGG